MKSSEEPLTRAELARLLRAFAHMIETAEPVPVVSRAPRRCRKNRTATAVVRNLDDKRLDVALRKLGVLP